MYVSTISIILPSRPIIRPAFLWLEPTARFTRPRLRTRHGAERTEQPRDLAARADPQHELAEDDAEERAKDGQDERGDRDDGRHEGRLRAPRGQEAHLAALRAGEQLRGKRGEVGGERHTESTSARVLRSAPERLSESFELAGEVALDPTPQGRRPEEVEREDTQDPLPHFPPGHRRATAVTHAVFHLPVWRRSGPRRWRTYTAKRVARAPEMTRTSDLRFRKANPNRPSVRVSATH